jgi:molecular chaperone DnaK
MAFFGIDFGTTNSCGVMLQHQQDFELGDNAGRPLPSIVAIDKATGRLTAGRHVWNTREERLQAGQEIVVNSVKRDLGRGTEWHTAAGVITAEDVTAEIFAEISKQVTRRNAPTMNRAAVTIPVGFSATSRAALRRAARKAGIEVSSFVHEPTAALMRFYQQVRHHSHVVVFDWGGGTLDISVMRLVQQNITEIATNGLPRAGDDIDDAMARAIHEFEMTKRGVSGTFEEMPTKAKDLLRTRCEVAKCEMTTRSETEILLYDYAGKELDFKVTREWFEHLVEPFVDQAIQQLKDAVHQARISVEDIGALVVIGGTSNLRLLKEKLLNNPDLATVLEYSNRPEWAVAHGAAVVDSLPGGYEIADSIGIVLSDAQMFPLISPGERAYPEARSVSLALVEDVMEANIVLAKCRPDSPGNLELALYFNVPVGGFDKERIALTYAITPDLVLEVTAQSGTRGDRDKARHQYEGLRFAYHIEN